MEAVVGNAEVPKAVETTGVPSASRQVDRMVAVVGPVGTLAATVGVPPNAVAVTGLPGEAVGVLVVTSTKETDAVGDDGRDEIGPRTRTPTRAVAVVLPVTVLRVLAQVVGTGRPVVTTAGEGRRPVRLVRPVPSDTQGVEDAVAAAGQMAKRRLVARLGRADAWETEVRPVGQAIFSRPVA